MVYRIILTLLILGGFVFLTIAGMEIHEQNQREKFQALQLEFEQRSFTFDLESFLEENATRISDEGIYYEEPSVENLILLFINKSSCVPCLNETHEYIRLVRGEFSDSVKPVVMLIHDDTQWAKDFYQISRFEAPFYKVDDKAAQTFFQENEMPLSQFMVFYSVPTSTVLKRTILPNAVTPEQHKTDLIQTAILQ